MREKEKNARFVTLCICIGAFVGGILSIVFKNIYLLTIFIGVGSGVGLICNGMKNKKNR